MRQIKELPSFANVAAGSTATLNCPVGPTYEKIILEYTGVTRAQMKSIRVEVNGKPIQEFKDGDRLDFINDYYGRSDTAGFLTLYFNRPEMNTLGHQRATALGTADVQTLTVKIDIDAAAVSPNLTAHALQSERQPLGAIVKVRRFVFSSATSGTFEIDSIPRGPRVLAAHFFKADVNDVEIEIDSFKVIDASKTLLEAVQKEHGRTPQTANATHVDFGMEGDLMQALATVRADGRTPVQDFRARLELGTSGAVDVVMEYLDGYAGI